MTNMIVQVFCKQNVDKELEKMTTEQLEKELKEIKDSVTSWANFHTTPETKIVVDVYLDDRFEPENIFVSQEEYNQLKYDSEFLNCLRANGVDNWEGYGEAKEMMEEEEEDFE